MIIISFELVFILFFVLALCADSLALSVTLWITQHWIAVKIGIYVFFVLVILIEVLPLIKKHSKGLIYWFAMWNTLRSIIAAEYFLFLLNDLAENYSTWGFVNKLLSMLGMQVMLIPLFAYILFEFVIDKMGGITYKSSFFGGILGFAGIVLGALLFLLLFCG